MRVCEEEVSGTLGIPTGHGLLDIQGFYDAMEWFLLIPAAIRLGFPSVVLVLELVQCLMPRA
eukprot:6112776-Pyramimonas_sp.AAC.1